MLVCAVAGLVGMGLGEVGLSAVLLGAVVATLIERWSPPPDDNLWMPILSGLGMVATEMLIGGEPVLFTLRC